MEKRKNKVERSEGRTWLCEENGVHKTVAREIGRQYTVVSQSTKEMGEPLTVHPGDFVNPAPNSSASRGVFNSTNGLLRC